MGTKNFYTAKEAILVDLNKSLAIAAEEMIRLKLLEKNSVDPDLVALEELEALLDQVRDAYDWVSMERRAVGPLVEAELRSKTAA